jgi:hypothetical protein
LTCTVAPVTQAGIRSFRAMCPLPPMVSRVALVVGNDVAWVTVIERAGQVSVEAMNRFT